jgi:nucleotide-binding universal stress UspA family protein
LATAARALLKSAMAIGPLIIAFDGTADAEEALREAAGLLAPRPALVVVVWKAGLGFELVELPAASIGLPPGPLDVRTALEVDRSLMEGAQRVAAHGAEVARSVGFDAEPLAVADDPDTPVAETLAQVARERAAAAVVIGAQGRGGILGDTTRAVIRLAPCPVVVRGPGR